MESTANDIQDGYLFISHSTSSKPPAKLNLLTCQVKPSLEENSKKYFDLVASKFEQKVIAFCLISTGLGKIILSSCLSLRSIELSVMLLLACGISYLVR